MPRKPEDSPALDQPAANRRNFLKGAALSGAAALTPAESQAATPVPQQIKITPPGPRQLAADTHPPEADPVNQSSSGGEFMVDVLKSMDIDYMVMMCASSFRGIHEAIVNYADNRKPEIITTAHEEIANAMAHGYAKMAEKPIATIFHGTVGVQHASMALYNAWCDRVPILAFCGNIIEADKRLPGAEWVHSAVDPLAMVRDMLKYDDQPASLQHFAESAVRAVKIATTPPMGPVMLSLDAELQENPIENRAGLRIPKYTPVIPPVGDPGALAEAARLLANAENPVIIVDRMTRTPAGLERLVAFAEALQCAVVDTGGRMNFPTRHPLNQSQRGRAVIAQADVILGIEMNDLWGQLHAHSDRVHRSDRGVTRAGAKVITLGNREMYSKSNFQDSARFQEADLTIAGDGESSLPLLTELVKKAVTSDRKSAHEERGKKLGAARLAAVNLAMSDATLGWDASPVSTARVAAELYAQIKDDDWSLVGSAIRFNWPQRLWNMDKKHRWNGGSGGAGIGYNAPAALGAALANKAKGRLSVAIQGDGDFMFVPSTLWTAAHHRIPLLYVMHNNRAYHQEYMYLQAMAGRRGRGATKAHIGTTLTDPNVDYATVARGMGIYGEGPITDPKELGPALKRALAVVRRGEPALVDVVTDQR